MKHLTLTKPEWASRADREVDLSDVYVDEIDPQNEQGAVVTGFMKSEAITCQDERYNDFDADAFRLEGICIEVADLTFFYDREAASLLLGVDAIWRVEQHEMEAA